MVEGGYFGYDDLDLNYQLEHDDDHDKDEQEVNRTRPFQPGAALTPYHGGEQHEMQTLMQEQSGLPDTSYEETPLLRYCSITNLQQESLLRQKMKKSVYMIKGKFPKANFEFIKIRQGTGKNSRKIVAIGSRGGEYKVFKDDYSGLTKLFLDSFQNKLGRPAQQIIAQDRDTIQEQRQRLEQAEKQQREADAIAAEREKELQEIANLKQQAERAQAHIDAIQQDYGSNLESNTELERLKQLKKNYKTEIENKKKEVTVLEKQAKRREKPMKGLP